MTRFGTPCTSWQSKSLVGTRWHPSPWSTPGPLGPLGPSGPLGLLHGRGRGERRELAAGTPADRPRESGGQAMPDKVPPEFYAAVDRFIALANELTGIHNTPRVSAVILFAAA